MRPGAPLAPGQYTLKFPLCPGANVKGIARPFKLNPVPLAVACEIVKLAVPLFLTCIVCEFVFTSRSLVSLMAAVAAGFGVMVMPRGRAVKTNLAMWEDAPLPKLPELYCGIFVRDGGNRTALEELADYLAADLRTQPQSPEEQTPSGTIAPIRASKAGH